MNKHILAVFCFCVLSVLDVKSAQLLCEANSALQINTEQKNVVIPSTQIREIIDKVDKLHRSKTSRADIEMEVKTAHWQRTLEMEVYTEGLDKTFINVKRPKREKDTKTLRIRNQMWNYLPKADKVMKIPPSMMMGSWMGSDFTNDDLVKESTLINDYTAQWFYPKNPSTHCYYISLKPKKETISLWDKIELIVDKKTLLPVKETYYDPRKGPMRVLTFRDVKKLGNRIIPAIMEMKPVNKKSNTTVSRYIDAEFDIKLPKNTFTLQNLQRIH